MFSSLLNPLSAQKRAQIFVKHSKSKVQNTLVYLLCLKGERDDNTYLFALKCKNDWTGEGKS